MYWWRRFDADEVEGDFARIGEAGFDSVRIFLLWEDFQPSPDSISSEALKRLIQVADAAARNALSLVVTLFTGHMSGVNWIPGWALEPADGPARFRIFSGGKIVRARIKNWYADQKIASAQELLALEVAAALADHPALWAWDLGNESSNCLLPHSRQAAAEWLERIASAIRSADARHPITLGLHMEDLEEDRLLGPEEAARVCDFLSMHGYPAYARWASGPTDELMLAFLGLITRWLAGSSRAAPHVLFEEFGAPTRPRTGCATENVALLDEDQAAAFTGRALEALRKFGLMGAMLWCYSDYSQELCDQPPFDEAPHERYFGLWRAPDNDPKEKPAVAEIKKFANLGRLSFEGDFAWADIAREDFYKSPRENLRRLYENFRRRYT
jgi:endo-1,4-beta-mannosidase